MTRRLVRTLKRAIRFVQDLPDEPKYRQLADYSIGDGYQRVYLYHIRKTGGTSLNLMFLSLGGEEGGAVYRRLYSSRRPRTVSGEKVFVGWDPALIQRGHYYYAFSHSPQHQLRIPDRTFTMTCLRDPAERVLSHYKMLYNYRAKNIPHRSMKLEGPWLGNSFSDFLTNIPREDLLRQLYMFSPRMDVDEAAERIAACSFFFFLEGFSSAVSSLSARLGVALTPLHESKSTLDVEISPEEHSRLQQMLEPEYLLMERLKETQKRTGR